MYVCLTPRAETGAGWAVHQAFNALKILARNQRERARLMKLSLSSGARPRSTTIGAASAAGTGSGSGAQVVSAGILREADSNSQLAQTPLQLNLSLSSFSQSHDSLPTEARPDENLVDSSIEDVWYGRRPWSWCVCSPVWWCGYAGAIFSVRWRSCVSLNERGYVPQSTRLREQ